MKFRGLLIAAILLAGLSGTLYFLERGKAGKSEEAESSKPEEKLFSVQASDIQEITVQPAGGEKVRLERSGDKWKIVEPRAVAADDTAASGMASTLSSLSVSETIDEKPASLKDYGLDPPQATVQFRAKPAGTKTLLLGESTPTGGGVYARTGDKPRVVTLSSYIKSDLTKTLVDLRDKSILHIDTNSASRAWLENKSGKLELAKTEDHWQLAAPVQARADSFAVSELIRQVGDAKMQAVEAEDGGPDAKYGLASPEFVFRVQDASGSHELRLSAEKSGKRYARSSDQKAIFTVGSDLITQLGKSAADLRNKDVFDMDTWTASHLDATTPEAHVVFDKQGGKWKGADPKKAPNEAAVSDALEKLKGIRATAFPPGGLPAKYGLDKPVIRASVAWGEKKLKETVEIGQAGDKAYARRQGEPGVYEVPADAVKAARDALNKLK